MKTLIKCILPVVGLIIQMQLMAQTVSKAVVSADLMNVLYIGIDNPISIAVPGVDDSKVNVSIANGSITRTNGKYIVKVTNTNDVTINVAVETAPAVLKSCGSYTFRVKRIPDPMVCVAGKCGTSITVSKETLLSHAELTINMGIPFELTFEIVSFTMTYKKDGNLYSETKSGNTFNEKMTDALKSFKTGEKFWIEEIKVKGPDGATRFLQSMTIILE